MSAPGKPLKRLSNERFSCMMMTMCLMVEEAVGAAGAGVGVTLLLPPQPPRRAAQKRSIAQSNRDKTDGSPDALAVRSR